MHLCSYFHVQKLASHISRLYLASKMQPVNINNLVLMISQFNATCIYKDASYPFEGVRICENNT